MKVLIVDDEQDVKQLFEQKFRREVRAGQLEFVFEFSAQAALDYLDHHATSEIGVVLSDINMPGMSGIDLLRESKARFSNLKFVMITAYSDESNYQAAIKYGSDDYLTKPVDFALLRNKVFHLH